MSEISKIPPSNVEAEACVLGSLLLDKEALFKVIDILQPSDFYDTRHEIIYRAILKLFEQKIPIDLVTLTNELEKENQLEDVGGVSYLTFLVNSVPTASNVESYATIVAEKSTLRKLISTAAEISNLGYAENKDLSTILDKSEQMLFSVSQRYLKRTFIHLSDLLTETFERIDELHKQKGKLRGLSTGFRDLDSLLGGFQPADLIILAARPAMGKTSFALNIAQYMATRNKIPVGIFSLEMSKEQLVERLICSEANINSWKLRTGNLSEEDFPKIGEAMAILSEAPIYIDDSPLLNVMEIRTKARRLQAEHGLGFLVVDYLQLMEGVKMKEGGRVQEITEISRSLKGLARELNIPVLAVSQLSRAVEQRPSHIPQLADLRESGSIEQDADVVIFLYREDYYDRNTEKKNIMDVLVKKHRNGPTGQVELYFEPSSMKFFNLERRDIEVPTEEIEF